MIWALVYCAEIQLMYFAISSFSTFPVVWMRVCNFFFGLGSYCHLTGQVPLQILADAMGFGKTVMTIALILARPYKGSTDGQESTNKMKDSHTKTLPKVKGGTLIVCPMALLGQWKVNISFVF